MTDVTPYQPTGSGKRIWHKPMTRDVVDCAQFAKHEARPIMPSPERDLIAYGLRELAAFREDKRAMMAYIGTDVGEGHSARRRAVAGAIRDLFYAQDERRNVAGLTRDQAAQACILAAKAERKAKP